MSSTPHSVFASRIPVDDETLSFVNGALAVNAANLNLTDAKNGSIQLEGAGASSANTITLKASTLGGNVTYTLPASPSAGSYLATDANGVLYWDAPAGAGDITDITTSGGSGLQGGVTSGSAILSLTDTGVAAGAYTKVTVDAQGRVVSGTNLIAADVPNLDAGKITTGTLPIPRGGTGATDASTARSNLGLGAAATKAVGTGANDVAAGDHTHANAVVDADFSSNGIMTRTGVGTYSTITDASTNWTTAYTDRLKWDGTVVGGGTAGEKTIARTALGLGSVATLDAGTLANNVVQLDGTGKLPAIDGSALLNLASGKIRQIVSSLSGAKLNGSAITPFDDTIPQITEGTEFYTLAVTPTNAASKILFICPMQFEATGDYYVTFHLHQDTTANALAAGTYDLTGGTYPAHAVMVWMVDAGSTTARTYRLRAGTATIASPITINGTANARKMGGVYQSGMVVVELGP